MVNESYTWGLGYALQYFTKFVCISCLLLLLFQTSTRKIVSPILHDSKFQTGLEDMCTSTEDRLIRVSSETIDTKAKSPYQIKSIKKCMSSSKYRQFYVQTDQDFSQFRRKELEDELGIYFGRYVPNNAYIVNMNCSTAMRAMLQSGIVWIGLRPHHHKIDSSLHTQLNSLKSHISQADLSIFVTMIQSKTRATENRSESILEAAESFRAGLSQQLGIRSQWRVASASKLAFDVPAARAADAARWLARRPEAAWIEPKAFFASRSAAAARVVVSGVSDYSRLSPVVETQEYGLTGAGQVVALADTGIDWDHCLIWNPSFPFPCFDPTKHPLYAAGTTSPSIDCSPSALAGLLASSDYLAFVRMMDAAGAAGASVSLLGSGSTVGVVSRPPPLDLAFPNVTHRLELGLRFPPARDPTFDALLATWSDFRPILLDALQPVLLLALCSNCGGQVVPQAGVNVFVPQHQYRYVWGAADGTAALMRQLGEPEYRALSTRLFQKCMCFFATPSAITVDPDRTWMGPVPPILEMLDLAYSPYAQVTPRVRARVRGHNSETELCTEGGLGVGYRLGVTPCAAGDAQARPPPCAPGGAAERHVQRLAEESDRVLRQQRHLPVGQHAGAAQPVPAHLGPSPPRGYGCHLRFAALPAPDHPVGGLTSAGVIRRAQPLLRPQHDRGVVERVHARTAL